MEGRQTTGKSTSKTVVDCAGIADLKTCKMASESASQEITTPQLQTSTKIEADNEEEVSPQGVTTSTSVVVVQPTHNEKEQKRLNFYSKVIDVIYESTENDSYAEGTCSDCCSKTIDCCNGCVVATKRIDPVFYDPAMRRARSFGWLIHRHITFPLFNKYFRPIWVIGQFLLISVILFLSIARCSYGFIEIFNIIHLVMSIFATILYFFDVLLLFSGCPFAKRLTPCKGKMVYKFENRSRKVCATATLDIGRIVISALILYPLVLCAIFDVIIFDAHFFDTKLKQISFVLLIMSGILLIVFVYALLIVAAISTIVKLQRKRFPPNVESSYSNTSIFLHVYFLFQLFGQILIQIVMIVSVGVIIYAENPEPFDQTCDEKPQVAISYHLWYMLAAAYIVPLFGVLNFYFVTYLWLQTYPIGLFIDFLSLKESNTPDDEKIQKIKNRLEFNSVSQTFMKKRIKFCLFHCITPFISPTPIIFFFIQLCLYGIFFTFPFFSLTNDSVDIETESVDMETKCCIIWEFFILVSAAGVVAVVNFYPFLIGTLYLSIVAAIWLVLSSLVILSILLFPFLFLPGIVVLLHLIVILCGALYNYCFK